VADENGRFPARFLKEMSFPACIEDGPFRFTKAMLALGNQIESCGYNRVTDAADGIQEAGDFDRASAVPETSLPAASMPRRMKIGDEEMATLVHDSRKFARETAEIINITHRERTDRKIHSIASNRNRQAIGLYQSVFNERLTAGLV
jgi:hypothetical protein